MFLAAMPDPTVFSLNWHTLVSIIIHLFNVGLLAFILSRLLYNPVKNFMANRANRVKEQLQTAEETEAKANELKALYEGKIKEIDKERDNILEEARKLAIERSKLLLAEAKKDADEMKAHAKLVVETERERIKDEIKEAIIDISAAMANKFITLNIDQNTQERLFAESMAEMEHSVFRSAN